MSKDKVRVVHVGCGGISKAWARVMAADPRIEVVGLVDVRREAAEAAAEQRGLDASVVFDTLAQALDRARPDAVFDNTIPEAHPQVTLEALGRGVHVLGEKPMGDTLPNARRMVEAARQSGKVYAVAQTRRPLAGSVAVQQALAAGILGRIEEVHVDFYIGARFTTGFRAQMRHPLVVDMAIHTFDQGRQLVQRDPRSVICHTFNPAHSWYDHHASAIAIFEMSDDVVMSYRGSWCAEGLNTSWQGAWRVIGEKGSLTWDGGDDIRCQIVDTEKCDGSEFFRPLKDVDVPRVELPHTGHAGIIRNFVSHLLEGEPLWCPCEDNIKSFAMVCAAVQSADEQGRKVAIDV
jgi:predicted dehydrogenase